jgi:hypothetical protein
LHWRRTRSVGSSGTTSSRSRINHLEHSLKLEGSANHDTLVNANLQNSMSAAFVSDQSGIDAYLATRQPEGAQALPITCCSTNQSTSRKSPAAQGAVANNNATQPKPLQLMSQCPPQPKPSPSPSTQTTLEPPRRSHLKVKRTPI